MLRELLRECCEDHEILSLFVLFILIAVSMGTKAIFRKFKNIEKYKVQ
jgi:hypothetical protein